MTIPNANAQPVNPLKSEAKALFLAGQAASQIAVTLDLRCDLVRSWISRGKWSIPRQAVEIRVNEALSQRVVSALARQGNNTRAVMAKHGQAMAEAIANEPITSFKQISGSGGYPGMVQVFKTLVEANSKVFGWDDPTQTALADSMTDFADAIDVESVEPKQMPETTTCSAAPAPDGQPAK